MFLTFMTYSCLAQQEYRFVYPKEFGDEEIILRFYLEEKQQKLVTTNSKLFIPEDFIIEADSITASFSFYKIFLEKADFENKTIALKSGLGLDEVVVKTKKHVYVGPNQKNEVPHRYAKGQSALLDLPTHRLPEDLKLVGIRYQFRKGNKLVHGYSSKGKRFKVFLKGYQKDRKNKRIDNLLGKELIFKIPNKIPKWFEVDLREFDINYKDFNFLVFGFEALDNGILMQQYQRSKEDLLNEKPSLHSIYSLHGEESLKIERKWFDETGLPLVQLIFEDLDE
ncbi:hypothetical protein GCM10010832_25250 [Psychroflexus planctonicus]|uniref:Uncharacterized protein n=2 Tax=Psychroflexus planctonicus TaxID=1526575 RepID=A0ABQ1SMV1_9FLAO|nr:hypothetical protein GCM10010832_25250 [Psychroflexus planctonicus]